MNRGADPEPCITCSDAAVPMEPEGDPTAAEPLGRDSTRQPFRCVSTTLRIARMSR